jgi:hypothetical protein
MDNLDKLHSEIVGETAAVETKEPTNAVVQAQPPAHEPAPASPVVDESFCEELIGECCEMYSDSRRETFAKILQPIEHVAPQEVERITKRAGMSEPIKKTVAKHGAATLRKHDLAKYIDSESALIAALALQWRSDRATLRDAKKVVTKFLGSNGAQRDAATGSMCPIETKTEKIPASDPAQPEPAPRTGETAALPVVDLRSMMSSTVKGAA